MQPSEELREIYNFVTPTGERCVRFNPDGPITSMDALAKRVEETEVCLALVLDSIDYTSGVTTPTEMIAAILPIEILERAKEARNAPG